MGASGRFRRGVATGAAALLVAATAPAFGLAAPPESPSWIDAPLDGSVLGLEPVEVVAHSADQDGIALVEIRAGRSPIASVAADGSRLVTSRAVWEPVGPGTYTITVRARDARGTWGDTATATVVVVGPRSPLEPPGETASPLPSGSGEPSMTPSPSHEASAAPSPSGPVTTASPAPTPAPTRTPIPTRTPPPPCEPPPPTPIYPTDFVIIGGPDAPNPPTFEWNYSSPPSCPVSGFVLHVYNYVVGYDVEVERSTNTWTPSGPLPADPSDPQGCGHYHWNVVSIGPDGPSEPSYPGSFKVCPTRG